MRLVIDGDSIKFEPDFKDFEIVLINVYDVMMKAVTIVPRVETKLYSEWVSSNDFPHFPYFPHKIVFCLVFLCVCLHFIISYCRLAIRKRL